MCHAEDMRQSESEGDRLCEAMSEIVQGVQMSVSSVERTSRATGRRVVVVRRRRVAAECLRKREDIRSFDHNSIALSAARALYSIKRLTSTGISHCNPWMYYYCGPRSERRGMVVKMCEYLPIACVTGNDVNGGGESNKQFGD